ncbi:unnamed protein product [Penicillium roqueforti FM164]|uniref:Uncharacterized protein n=1 Tax=Penicillium roqueforti (strain FM164) TaxID=1365484 RepID=W6QHK7_PENRF|nr:unnamed protein product [Penicillium roqueforti FM164]
MVLAWASSCLSFLWGEKWRKSATLLLCPRFYFRARDSTFVSATLLLCLRLYFCVCGCTFVSATLLASFLIATAENDPSCELESLSYNRWLSLSNYFGYSTVLIKRRDAGR